MKLVSRPKAAVGIAIAQLRHDRMRTILAVLGITLAVLATTLLAGTGIGVIETGQEKFDSAGRDLWVTGGPLRFSPGTVGGIQNSLFGAHQLAEEIRNHEDVNTAAPLLFQTVYISTDGEGFETYAAMGVPKDGGLKIEKGRGWGEDDHFADGNYTGPMQHEILIDRQTAKALGVGINDTVYVGGTIAAARKHKFTVIGISPTGSRFIGSPTISMPLSELQEITGKTGTDPATIIPILLTDGADPKRVEAELQAAYPGYEIRTNREQLQATIERQSVVLAGGASLFILAIAAGLGLTVNTILSMLHQQREVYGALLTVNTNLSMLHQQREVYGALLAIGASRGTLGAVSIVESLIIGVIGGGIGVLGTLAAARGLNVLVLRVTGFENVIRTPDIVLLTGGGIAIVMSIIGAIVAGWQLSRMTPLEELDR